MRRDDRDKRNPGADRLRRRPLHRREKPRNQLKGGHHRPEEGEGKASGLKA